MFSEIQSKSYYISGDVNAKFQSNIQATMNRLGSISPKVSQAVSKVDNVIILKDNTSEIPENFCQTKDKFDKCAKDAYGFVSRKDNAIVLVQDNHERKNKRLEGDVSEQGSDTLTHEIGHLLDDNYSTSHEYIKAYITDLNRIYAMLQDDDSEICDEDLDEAVVYLKHYMEGVDFSDGISKDDITREGLRENFAECFSTITDSNPSKINEIYAKLFPNTMELTLNYMV